MRGRALPRDGGVRVPVVRAHRLAGRPRLPTVDQSRARRVLSLRSPRGGARGANRETAGAGRVHRGGGPCGDLRAAEGNPSAGLRRVGVRESEEDRRASEGCKERHPRCVLISAGVRRWLPASGSRRVRPEVWSVRRSFYFFYYFVLCLGFFVLLCFALPCLFAFLSAFLFAWPFAWLCFLFCFVLFFALLYFFTYFALF